MTDKPRVLHLTHTMNQGGIERQLAQLPYLMRDEFEMEIGILYPLDEPTFFFEPELKAKNIPYTLLDKYPGKLARLPFMWRYRQLLQRFRPHIIHAHDWHAMDIARAFHRFFGGAKVIGHVHNNQFTPERIAAEQRWADSADLIITAAYLVEDLYRQHIPIQHLATLPNGVDTDYFKPADHQLARQSIPNFPQDAQIGLFAGRYTVAKNLPLLLQAVHELKTAGEWGEDWKIICIGRSDPPHYGQQLESFRREHHLEDDIEFWPPQAEILRFYQACDFLILPSLSEGLPVVVLEASSCGRPTLISTAGNADDLIQDPERGWIFADNNLADLKRQLVSAFQLSGTEREKRGENARQYIIENYSFPAVIQEYREVYYRLLKQGT